jgi:hypothetical protein
MTPLDDGDRLRIDYQATNDLLRTLTDVRFKLLAFVPTIAGAAVGLVSRPRSAAELLAIGLLGLVATAGILLYELRNSQVFDSATRRAAWLEGELGFRSPLRADATGGLQRELPGRDRRLLGIATIAHETALALVYGAALAGWSYLVAWGALRSLDVGSAQKIGAAVGAAIGILAVLGVSRLDAPA